MSTLIESWERDAPLADFASVAEHAAASDPRCHPASLAALEAGIRRGEFQGRQCVFLMRSGPEPVARAVARVAPVLKDDTGAPVGMIGFYEDDSGDPRPLLEAAVEWLRTRGCRTVVGPMDGDTWHKYRFNTGPFDEPPFPLEPWNPARYGTDWARCGFRVLETYTSKAVADVAGAAAASEKFEKRATREGFQTRPLDVGRWESELALLHSLSLRIFSNNYLYTDIPLGEFAQMYAGAQPMVDSDFVRFALAPDGREAGFIFSFRDAAGSLNVKTLGMTPEFRRTGAVMMLMHEAYRAARDRGLGRVNLCLMRAGNDSERVDMALGRVFRQYALYHLPPGVSVA